MQVKAHLALAKNLKRASYFLDLHEGRSRGAGTPGSKRRELPRGAVVFAIGALDAYLSEVSAEVMLVQRLRPRIGGRTRLIEAEATIELRAQSGFFISRNEYETSILDGRLTDVVGEKAA